MRNYSTGIFCLRCSKSLWKNANVGPTQLFENLEFSKLVKKMRLWLINGIPYEEWGHSKKNFFSFLPRFVKMDIFHFLKYFLYFFYGAVFICLLNEKISFILILPYTKWEKREFEFFCSHGRGRHWSFRRLLSTILAHFNTWCCRLLFELCLYCRLLVLQNCCSK